MNRYLVIFLLLTLTACVAQQEEAGHVATDIKDSAYETSAKLKDWATTSPIDKRGPLPVAPTYCYRAQTDILCYHHPMPGWETRLVAYQGTGAEPPPPSITQPLPVQAPAPVNRNAGNSPVFVNMPPPVTAASDVPPPATEAGRDPLTDPALAPQL